MTNDGNFKTSPYQKQALGSIQKGVLILVVANLQKLKQNLALENMKMCFF